MKSLLLFLGLLVTAQAEPASINTIKLLSLFGKDIRGKEAQDFLNSLNSKPEIQGFEETMEGEGKIIPGTVFFIYKDKGLTIRGDQHGIIIGIFFYSGGLEEYRQYPGVLPYRLNFTMTRGEVEKIIGMGSEAGEGDFRGVREYYSAKRMDIDYGTKDRTDMTARILSIHLERKL